MHRSSTLVSPVPFALFLAQAALAQAPSAPEQAPEEEAAEEQEVKEREQEPYASAPTRPVSLRAELEFCLRPRPSANRAACLQSVAEVLAAGLRYQECLWGLQPDDASCEQGGKLPRNGDGARKMLELGGTLRDRLRSGLAEDGALRAAFAEFRRSAADAYRHERSTYSLVSQGGVSFGSWQAGYIYYLTEVLKLRRDEGEEPRREAFSVLTGASAGAINALAAGIQSCAPSVRQSAPAPRESLFYKVWVDTLGLFRTGAPGLLPMAKEGEHVSCRNPKEDDPAAHLGVFSTAPLCEAMRLAQGALETAHGDGSCGFDFGFSVTHLKNVHETVYATSTAEGQRSTSGVSATPAPPSNGDDSIVASRLTEYFALRVTPNAQPSIENRLVTRGSKPLTALLGVLPASEDSPISAHPPPRVAVDDFLDAVRASGAFPVAFPPVTLDYAHYSAGDGEWKHRRSDFVDGGTLDNAPVALAASMNAAKRKASVADNPWFEDLVSLDTYFFVNPNVVSWRTPGKDGAAEPVGEGADLLGTLWSFGVDLFSTSSDAALVNATRQLDFLGATDEESRARLQVPRRHLPVAGAEFGHFMAFLEKDFRNFDFFVGLVDGEKHLRSVAGLEGYGDELSNRLEAIPEYACLRAYYADRQLQERPRVVKTDLPGRCTRVEPNFARMLAAMHNYKQWTKAAYDRAKSFDRFFQELTDAGFQFKDMGEQFGFGPFQENPKYSFRLLVQRAIDELADKHDFPKGQVIKVAGQVAADAALTRMFPKYTLNVGYALNGFELGVAQNLIAWPESALRATARGRFYRMSDRGVDRNGSTGQRAFGAAPSGFVGLTLLFQVVPHGLLDGELSGGGSYSALWLPGRGDMALQQYGTSLGFTLSALQRIYLGVDVEFFDGPLGRTIVADSYRGSELDHDSKKVRWNGAAGLRFPF